MALPDEDVSREPDPLLDADDGSGRGESRGGFVQDFVKKVAVAGLGALFMTEEGIRGVAGQMKLPKDVLAYILSQADRTKNDLTRVVSEEVRGFLRSETLREEFLKLLSGMSVEVTAQIRLVPEKPAAQASDPEAKPPLSPEVNVTRVGVHARRGRRGRRD